MQKNDSESEHTYKNSTFIRDVWGFVRPYRVRFWVASFLRALGDIVWLYPAYAIAQIVDTLSVYDPSMDLGRVWLALVGFAGAVVARYVLMWASKRMMFAISEQTALDAQLRAMEYMLRLPMDWHKQEGSGSKLKRIDRGAQWLDRSIRIWVTNIIQIAINLLGVTIILATIDVWVGVVTAVFLVTFYMLARFYIVRAGRASDVVNEGEDTMHSLVFETINNIRTVQVLDMRETLLERLARMAENLYASIRVRIFWFQTGNLTRGTYGHLFRVGMLAFIVYGITQGHYELGFLVLFNTYFSEVFTSLIELADVVQDLVVAKYSVGRMMSTYEVLARPVDESEQETLPADWRMLRISNLSFSYGDVQVLRDVSFTLHRGERVGVVGLSGAGKSTLFKLLLREHEAPDGCIQVDEHALNSIRRSDWLAESAVVLQDTEVFNMTLKDNIVMSDMSATNDVERLKNALQIAHVTDYLHKLPQGVDTIIGEKGIRLSGGERQRLGIARAVFKQPQLLLMDEATSHLDLESEEKIRDSLHQFFGQVTALVIAHRLTTVKEMDRILVLHEGRIVEEGDFEQLMSLRGRFYELWEKQRL